MTRDIEPARLSPVNLLIAGIPRSGTTLTCWLINQLPDAVALPEPMDMLRLTQAKDSQVCMKEIGDFLERARNLALEGRPLPGKFGKAGGSNYFQAKRGGRRQLVLDPSASVTTNKLLKNDFLLAVKHPNAFAALLPLLAQRYKCCAIVRNPLSVLASWETIEAAVHYGHAPVAEALNQNLRLKLRRISDPFERQLTLLDWYYRTFASALHESSILRYEDIVLSGGRALSQVIPSADGLPNILRKPLVNRNENAIYDNGPLLDQYAGALLRNKDHACWRFYTQSEINQVHEATKGRRR